MICKNVKFCVVERYVSQRWYVIEYTLDEQAYVRLVCCVLSNLFSFVWGWVLRNGL